jgi:hypothetical protein
MAAASAAAASGYGVEQDLVKAVVGGDRVLDATLGQRLEVGGVGRAQPFQVVGRELVGAQARGVGL